MMYMVGILIILCYPFVLSKLAHQQYNYNLLSYAQIT